MSRISRWEWHGSVIVLVLLCLVVVLLPVAVVYFMTNLLRIDEDVQDVGKLSAFLEAKRR